MPLHATDGQALCLLLYAVPPGWVDGNTIKWVREQVEEATGWRFDGVEMKQHRAAIRACVRAWLDEQGVHLLFLNSRCTV